MLARQPINRLIGKSKNLSRGFTLVELLVVVGMIALITGALSTSISGSMQRARVQKASAEVKSLTQAILAYENYEGDLPTVEQWKPADFTSTLKFLNGMNGDKVPVLIQAALSKGGVMRDPWGQPYYVKIRSGKVVSPTLSGIRTGCFLPNFYRLTEEERK